MAYKSVLEEWDYTTNTFTPEDVKPFSSKKVWWICKVCKHKWIAAVSSRTANGTGCPACSHNTYTKDNNLAVKFPHLLKEWDYEANGVSRPESVAPFSNRKFVWKCLKNHKWIETVAHRTAMSLGCPYCSGKRASAENNLLLRYPDIAKQLCSDNQISPTEITPSSHHEYKWKCDRHHIWTAPVVRRTLGKSGCPYCAGKLPSPEYNLAVKFPHLLKEWDYEANIVSPTELTPGTRFLANWRCEKQHKWQAIVKNRTSQLLLTGCPKCSNNYTDLERFVEEKLGINKFDLPALSEYRFRPDFKLSDDVFMNADGLYHHSENRKDRNYHVSLRKAFEAENKRLLQFYADEIYNKWPIVSSIIDNVLGNTKNSIGARKCVVKPISVHVASDFLNFNHLQGEYIFANYAGLFFDEKLVSLMGMKTEKTTSEIIRFCNVINVGVIGAFSKLLRYFISILQPKMVISFCDLRYFVGGSYIKNGFSKAGESLNWYWTDGRNRFPRQACRAADGKSERVLAFEKKWYKIYGAGHAKYILDLSK